MTQADRRQAQSTVYRHLVCFFRRAGQGFPVQAAQSLVQYLFQPGVIPLTALGYIAKATRQQFMSRCSPSTSQLTEVMHMCRLELQRVWNQREAIAAPPDRSTASVNPNVPLPPSPHSLISFGRAPCGGGPTHEVRPALELS